MNKKHGRPSLIAALGTTLIAMLSSGCEKPEPVDIAPTQAIERAKGLEQSLEQGVEDKRQAIDEIEKR